MLLLKTTKRGLHIMYTYIYDSQLYSPQTSSYINTRNYKVKKLLTLKQTKSENGEKRKRKKPRNKSFIFYFFHFIFVL